jgi:uncharacterized lipoprotein NlpE involved in copper resistance
MKTTLILCLTASFAFAQKPAKPATPRAAHTTPNTVVHQKHSVAPPAAAVHDAPVAQPQPQTIVSYEQLTRTANVYTKRQNAQNEKLYSLSTHDKGGFRDENNHVITLNDSTNAECKIRYTEIGFYFPDKNEWSWIWFGNPSINRVRDYGKSKKMDKLTTETAIMTLAEATELANAAAYILSAKGVQIIPAPDGSHFWFIANDAIDCTK